MITLRVRYVFLNNTLSNERRRIIGPNFNLPADGQAKHPLRLPISCAISHRSSMACISRLVFQVACACITTRVIHAYLQFRRSSVALYYSSRPYATPTHPIAHHRLRIQSQHRPFDDWFTCILRYLFWARFLLLWFLARYVVLFPPQDGVKFEFIQLREMLSIGNILLVFWLF